MLAVIPVVLGLTATVATTTNQPLRGGIEMVVVNMDGAGGLSWRTSNLPSMSTAMCKQEYNILIP